ncbi:hypothetical protein [Paenisporosarcina indica]|uniref:hypothetical protein n=1 Tax=Paenisporosarcina indica TaxID=650093 RepID=UPI0009501DD5|nr:hypothetical protein [Paenisporosarcina indica]
MRKRNDKEKIKRLGYALLAFAAFVFSICLIFINWQEYEALKKDNEQIQTPTTVYGKTANQDLFGKTYYYALIENGLIGKTTTKLKVGQKASISKEEFDKIEIGDSLNGYTVNGTFHTQADLDEEYTSFYVGLAFFSLYPIGYILYLVSKINIVRAMFERIEHAKGLNRTINILGNSLLFGGVIVGLLFFVFDFGDMLKSGYDRFMSEKQIETIALVADHDIVINSSMYANSVYNLGLVYKNQNDQIVSVTKEVTKHSYDKYKDDPLPIKYNEQDYYRVYLQEVDFVDIFQIFTSDLFILFYLAVIIIALLIFLLFVLRKRKKYGYY